MAIDACIHAILLKQFSQALDVFGKAAWMHRGILDKGNGFLGPLDFVENRAGNASDLLKHIRIFIILGHLQINSHLFLTYHFLLNVSEFLPEPFFVFLFKLDKKKRFNSFRKIGPHLRLLFPGEVENLPFNNLNH